MKKYGLNDVVHNILTNATLFHKPSVQSALDALWLSGGRVCTKLDAGTQAWFERVDGTRLSLDKVTQNITWSAQQHPIVLLCMSHRFGDESPSGTEIEAWVTRVKGIIDAGGQVEWVQIYTTARKPSDDSVLPLEASFLHGVSDALTDELGSDSQVRVTMSAPF